MINVQWCWLLHSLSCQITRKGTSLPNDIQNYVSWRQHGTASELIDQTLRGQEAPNHMITNHPQKRFNQAHPMWFHILSRKMKKNSWMIAKDPFSNCLNSPFSLSVDSVIPSDTDKDLHHFDSLELCLYMHLCLYLYFYLLVNSDIPSEHTVLQHLDSHNYNIYSLSVWVFQ